MIIVQHFRFLLGHTHYNIECVRLFLFLLREGGRPCLVCFALFKLKYSFSAFNQCINSFILQFKFFDLISNQFISNQFNSIQFNSIQLSFLILLLDTHLKEFDALSVKHGKRLIPQKDDTPHKCGKPQGRVLIGLVLANDDCVWDRQQSDHDDIL